MSTVESVERDRKQNVKKGLEQAPWLIRELHQAQKMQAFENEQRSGPMQGVTLITFSPEELEGGKFVLGLLKDFGQDRFLTKSLVYAVTLETNSMLERIGFDISKVKLVRKTPRGWITEQRKDNKGDIERFWR